MIDDAPFNVFSAAIVNNPRCASGVTTNGVWKNNGEAVMGAGVAKTAKLLYPQLPVLLGKLLRQQGNNVYLLIDAPTNIFSFPTKHHWRDNSDPRLIVQSATQLVKLADDNQWELVFLPRPGCNNGKLDWRTQVKPLLAPLLDSRFVICTGPKR